MIPDFYSKYPIIRKLTSTTFADVINHLKSYLQRIKYQKP